MSIDIQWGNKLKFKESDTKLQTDIKRFGDVLFEIQQVAVDLVVNIWVVFLLAQVQARDVHGGLDKSDITSVRNYHSNSIQKIPKKIPVHLSSKKYHGYTVLWTYKVQILRYD